MTKELRKEAKEWCQSKHLTLGNVGYFISNQCEQSYIAGAEPREKRIEELLALVQAERKRQARKIAELKEQIEKMKDSVVNWCEGCERLPKLYKEMFS